MRARGSLPRSLPPSCSWRRSDRRARDLTDRLANGMMRASSSRRLRRSRLRRMPATRRYVLSADRHRISTFRSSAQANRARSHLFRPTRRPRRARTESRPLPSADTTQQRLPCPDVGRSPRASAQPPSHFSHMRRSPCIRAGASPRETYCVEPSACRSATARAAPRATG